MKAVVCNRFGPPELLRVEDRPKPVAGPGQVVVSIHATGVNFPDALLVQGKHQYRPEPPFLFGGEFAGVVSEVGNGVSKFNKGDRVYGSRVRGAFAEAIAVDVDKLRPMPAGLSFEDAAGLSTTYNTAYYALVILAALRPGESVLVLGAAGGVGLAAIDIAKAQGARVIAAASSPERLAVCANIGADDLIDYSREDLRERIKHLTAGSGVDIIFDPVGGSFSEPALRSMAWRGRYLVVGFASGAIPKVPLNLVLLKGCSVIGVFLGESWTREPGTALAIDQGMQALISAGMIHPLVSATYPMEKIADALNALLRREVIGKVIVIP